MGNEEIAYAGNLTGQFDDDIMQKFFDGEEITEEQLIAAIRKGTVSLKMTPVLCGSSYRNKGVQKLLDAIVDFLPSPLDVPSISGEYNGKEGIVRHPSDSEPLSGLCLLYKSDAADDLLCVDLGGRLLIKKKNSASLTIFTGTLATQDRQPK